MTHRRLLPVLLVAALGCADVPLEADEHAEITVSTLPCFGLVFSILPSDTSLPSGAPIGSGVDSYAPNRPHIARRGTYGSPCAPPANPRLVVFLPGHTQSPADFPDFILTAIAQHYHVIGLDYPNPVPLFNVCDGAPLSCYGQTRDEIVFGDNGTSHLLDGHPQDAITTRVRRLLHYLAEVKDPSGDWDTFLLGNGNVDWSKVVIAGHGGYEAYMGKHLGVSRVVMLGTVSDGDGSGSSVTSAPWIVADPTPGRYHGLTSIYDTGQHRHDRVIHNWGTIGVPAAQRHDSTLVCWGCTALEVHDSLAMDEAAYGAIWKAMLGSTN